MAKDGGGIRFDMPLKNDASEGILSFWPCWVTFQKSGLLNFEKHGMDFYWMICESIKIYKVTDSR